MIIKKCKLRPRTEKDSRIYKITINNKTIKEGLGAL